MFGRVVQAKKMRFAVANKDVIITKVGPDKQYEQTKASSS